MAAAALGASGVALLSWAGHLLAVWLLGLILGWLLPRPKWLRRAGGLKSPLMLTSPGVWLGRAAVAWNALLLVREVWYRFCHPGTFRALIRSAWASLTTGQPLQWPQLGADAAGAASAAAAASGPLLEEVDPLRWYVTAADLETFKDVVERGAGPAWQEMMRKEWPGCSYTAWRRTLASGKTEYKSVTVSSDATAQEFMDFYLDDDVRPLWDGMITTHDLLEAPPALAPHRCQVVRWLRSFPFAFISRREYVIARRVFAFDGGATQYGITRAVEHPAAPRAEQGLVRMEAYHSMWRSRTVPCPHGSSRPACETTLLHFEDFNIPEHLARFTVRHGMAGFVAKMVPRVTDFVASRRLRCDPDAADPSAYGAGLQPLMRHDSAASTLALTLAADAAAAAGARARSPSCSDLTSCADDSASERSGRVPRSRSIRGLACMLLASGVAVALSRSGPSGGPPAAEPPAGSAAAGEAPPVRHAKHAKQHVHGALSGQRQRASRAVAAKLRGLHSHRLHGSSSPGGGGVSAAALLPPPPRRRHRQPHPAGIAAATTAANALE